jgi:glycerol-3-phosphate acyltransferase PlsY
MKGVFFFESMITPKIITIVYWFILFVVVIVGIGAMFATFSGVTFGSFLRGLGIIVGGAIAARIWCELLIVLFKIHENIRKLADTQA